MSEEINKTQQGGAEPREVKIEISKYKSLLDVLGDANKTWRVLFAVFFLGIILFTGIAVVASAIKKLYPYSDITTNGLGATTFKSEKSEVSYWLYNTSQLWSNSGITVNAGDVISVRASGKFITAMHHVYDNVKNNIKLKDAWVGTEGEQDHEDYTSSSYLRRTFRMFPSLPTGALVMQVVENELFDTDRIPGAKKDNFYFIGKEREHIYIKNAGTLYFSLNDIVLNKETIFKMVYDCLKGDLENDVDSLVELYEINKKGLVAKLKSEFKDIPEDYLLNHPEDLFRCFNILYGDKIQKMKPGDRKLGDMKIGVSYFNKKDIEKKIRKEELEKILSYNSSIDSLKQFIETLQDKSKYRISDGNKRGKDNGYFYTLHESTESKVERSVVKDYLDKIKEKWKESELNDIEERTKLVDDLVFLPESNIAPDTIVKICELEYYYRADYKTAWFDDNMGSFLIVIEKNFKQ